MNKSIYKQLGGILSKRQKRQFWILLAETTVGMFLECVGLSLIVPVIAVLLKPSFLTDHALGIWLSNLVQTKDANTFLLRTVLLMTAAYALKNAYLLLTQYLESRFILQFQFGLKKQLLSGFLYSPYYRYLDYATPDLQEAVETDADGSTIMLENLMKAGNSVIMLLVLVVFLAIMNPAATALVLAVYASVVFLYMRGIRPYLANARERYRTARRSTNKWIFQTLANRKEIKAEKKEDVFLSNFELYAKEAAQIDTRLRFLQATQRPMLELGCILTIVLILLLMIFQGAQSEEIIGQLSVFSLVSLRIMPAVLRLSQYGNSMQWYGKMLERTAQRLQDMEKWKEDIKDAKPWRIKQGIRLDQVSFRYPGTEKQVLDHVSLYIPAGKITGICGASGIGKTTLIDLLTVLLLPDEGEITADDICISDAQDRRLQASWHAGIAYIPQNVRLLNATVRENILFGTEDRGDEKIWEALKRAEAAGFVADMPQGLDTIVGEGGNRLSGGQCQRIAFARSFYRNAGILILDEATSALDSETEEGLLATLRKWNTVCETENEEDNKVTVILVSHRSGTLSLCDQVFSL